jgi:imidazolonepropionase-like amidohydrolase/Tol biopolymer transport system component
MIKNTVFALGFTALITLSAAGSLAQDTPKTPVADWHTNSKQISFSVTEGTWMNLDVSPDGTTIVFDMLGDIYSIPITGGKARVLQSGPAWQVQPRFSPDGKTILFTSDAGGGDNVWFMDADGSNARQITREDFRLLNNAVWMPDGEYFVARKHFTGTRSLGAGEMWMYHRSGGTGLQLTQRKNDQQDVNEPNVSPDGRYVYYSEDVYAGGQFLYNKDPNSQIYVIKRYDRQKGTNETVLSGPGGAARPQVSRDGNHIAFVRRVRNQSVLFLYDTRTAEEWPIFDKLDMDQQEAWAIFGVYPGFAWTPGDKHIVIWGQGKLWKVAVDGSGSELIPFEVDVKQQVAEALRFEQNPAPDMISPKVIRHAATSPDGKTLVFNAVGYLWKKDLPNGKPVRLTKGVDFEFEPAFSPDGSRLVYVTWDDEEMGRIMLLDMRRANATPSALTTVKGIYRTPKWSPDGTEIVYSREPGNNHQGFAFTNRSGLYRMKVSGGEPVMITQEGQYPQYSADGKRIFYQTGGYFFGALGKGLKSVNIDGAEALTHFTSRYANRMIPSPDGKWMAYQELFKVYLVPLVLNGNTVDLSATTKAVPITQVTKDAGIALHWSADGSKLHWTYGDEYFTADVQQRFAHLNTPGAKPMAPDSTGLKIGLEVPLAKPSGRTAFTNARIITMKGNEVIENGVIVVNGNRIEAVGAAGSVTVPSDAKVVDASGKTIMPGLVDVHAHVGDFREGLSPKHNWYYYANLAYGVTTSHDPSSHTEMIFAHSELIKSGAMVGPRLFSTGIILYGADGDFKAVINNLDDARSALRRTKAFGAFSVKSYNQPRRDQRLHVLTAAKELEMNVVPEGGSHFFHNMTMVMDGHTGVEHNIPIAKLYDDVVKFWSSTKVGYTLTLIVNYGSLNGEFYWYQNTDVWSKERLLRFTPRSIVDARSRHRTMVPDEEYDSGFVEVSRSAKKLADAGVKVNMGAHGQLQGLGAHWETWMIGMGGQSNMETLRSATWNGAYYLGMEKHIGSLETGKLADLIVLDANPLEDIRNTEHVRYTMINGKLYDAATMREYGSEGPAPEFWWQRNRASNAFPWFGPTQGFTVPQCGCGVH